MIMKLDCATAATTSQAEPKPPADDVESNGASDGTDSRARSASTGHKHTHHAGGKDAKGAPANFAALLQGATAPAQTKGKSALGDASMGSANTAANTMEAASATTATDPTTAKSALAKKKSGPTSEDDSDEGDPSFMSAMPVARPLATAIHLTLSMADPAGSVTTEDELTGDGGGGGAGAESNARFFASAMASSGSIANSGQGGDPHAIPSFPPMNAKEATEPSALTDAKNGLSATSGVHPTAKAISAAEDQVVAAARTTTAQTYAALAPKADPTMAAAAARALALASAAANVNATPAANANGAPSATIPQAAGGQAAPGTGPNALRDAKKESGAIDAVTSRGDAKSGAPNVGPGPAGSAAGNGGQAGHGGRNGQGASDQAPDRDASASTSAKTTEDANAPPASSDASAGTSSAGAFTLPLPVAYGTPTILAADAQPKADPAARTRFGEDTIATVERAVQSGQERTDVEIRAFDGTRVAVRVQVIDDKVHVGFSFDAKHSAAEESVRATVSSLEARLSERGMSTVVSFGTKPGAHETVNATNRSSSGADAGASGAGSGNAGTSNPRDNGRERGAQFSDIHEIAPGRARTTTPQTQPTPGTPNGRGWVA